MNRLFSLLWAFRFQDWYVQVLLHVACTTAYAVAAAVPLDAYLWAFAITTLVLSLAVAGGYLANNVSDVEGDAHKPAPFFTTRRRLNDGKVAAVVLCGSAMVLAHLIGDSLWLPIIAWGQLILGIGYSLPPLRFKERGGLGLFASAVSQRLPAFLMLVALLPADGVAATLITAWLTNVGLAFIVDHQLMDLPFDQRSGTRTWARDVGFDTAMTLRRLVYRGHYVLSVAVSLWVTHRGAPGIGLATGVGFLAFSVVLAWAGERVFCARGGRTASRGSG